MDINYSIHSGRLTDNAKFYPFTSKQGGILRFTIASTTETYKDKDGNWQSKTDFFDYEMYVFDIAQIRKPVKGEQIIAIGSEHSTEFTLKDSTRVKSFVIRIENSSRDLVFSTPFSSLTPEQQRLAKDKITAPNPQPTASDNSNQNSNTDDIPF